jgi:GNAT superfamily N-acetyltransferase
MSEVERKSRAAAIEIAAEPSGSADALACLDAYFAELAARFDAGFDASASPSPPEDYAPPHGAFVMARLDGRPVGIGALKALDAGAGEIKRVWTAPDARGLGVARRILHALEGAARQRGFALLRLDTNRTLIEAQAFYAGEGYREIPRYNDNPYADHWFEKRLDAPPA